MPDALSTQSRLHSHLFMAFAFAADYHYVTREVMQAGIDNGEFIENAEFSGNMYGTR